MARLASLFVQFVVGSARVRALVAGLPIGLAARALGDRGDGGMLAPALAAGLIVAGVLWVLQFTIEGAHRRGDETAPGALAERTLGSVGVGILLAMHVPGWLV